MKLERESLIGPVAGSVVRKAEAACLCFSACQAKSFDLKRRNGWGGRLTVEIGQRLKRKDVTECARYPRSTKSQRLDLLAGGPNLLRALHW